MGNFVVGGGGGDGSVTVVGDVAVTVADGDNVVLGSTTDAAVTSDSNGTISGKLRGLVKWAFERMPASLGRKPGATSFPVARSSEAFVTATLDANNEALVVPCEGYSSVTFLVSDGGGDWSATFEGSIDDGTFYLSFLWAHSHNYQTSIASWVNAINSTSHDGITNWTVNCLGLTHVRLRIDNVFSAGSITVWGRPGYGTVVPHHMFVNPGYEAFATEPQVQGDVQLAQPITNSEARTTPLGVRIRNVADTLTIEPVGETTFTTRIPVNGQAAMAASVPVVIASNQSTLPVSIAATVSTTTARTSLTASSPAAASVGVASAQAVASNANRKGLILVNTSSNTISIAFGATAVLDSGITLTASGGAFNMGEYDFNTGAINAIAGGASSNLAIQEFT